MGFLLSCLSHSHICLPLTIINTKKLQLQPKDPGLAVMIHALWRNMERSNYSTSSKLLMQQPLLKDASSFSRSLLWLLVPPALSHTLRFCLTDAAKLNFLFTYWQNIGTVACLYTHRTVFTYDYLPSVKYLKEPMWLLSLLGHGMLGFYQLNNTLFKICNIFNSMKNYKSKENLFLKVL